MVGKPSEKLEKLYDVEKILDRRTAENGEIQYLIKWLGYPSTVNTWEPVRNLETCLDLVEEFEANFNANAEDNEDEETNSVTASESDVEMPVLEKMTTKNLEQEHRPPTNQKFCFICNGEVFDLGNGKDVFKDKNQLIFFVLKNLMKVPEDKLRSGWRSEDKNIYPAYQKLEVCLWCHGQSNISMGLYQEVIDLVNKIKDIQKEFMEEMRRTRGKNRNGGCAESKFITDLRQFVTLNECRTQSKPFLVDLKAVFHKRVDIYDDVDNNRRSPDNCSVDLGSDVELNDLLEDEQKGELEDTGNDREDLGNDNDGLGRYTGGVEDEVEGVNPEAVREALDGTGEELDDVGEALGSLEEATVVEEPEKSVEEFNDEEEQTKDNGDKPDGVEQAFDGMGEEPEPERGESGVLDLSVVREKSRGAGEYLQSIVEETVAVDNELECVWGETEDVEVEIIPLDDYVEGIALLGEDLVVDKEIVLGEISSGEDEPERVVLSTNNVGEGEETNNVGEGEERNNVGKGEETRGVGKGPKRLEGGPKGVGNKLKGVVDKLKDDRENDTAGTSSTGTMDWINSLLNANPIAKQTTPNCGRSRPRKQSIIRFHHQSEQVVEAPSRKRYKKRVIYSEDEDEEGNEMIE